MKILSPEQALSYQSTALKRGHVVFTSLLVKNGKPLFLKDHIDRLCRGADFLFANVGWILERQKIKHYVESLIKNLSEDSYIRLTIFDDAFYSEVLPHKLASDSLKLAEALKVKTPGLCPHYLKLSQYVDADLEIIRAQLKGFDDIVFFDQYQMLTEASTSNIFIVNENGIVQTPILSSMVLEGVTRKKIIETLVKMEIKLEEVPINKEELLKAKEIWLTNSIKGLRFVEQYEEKKFVRTDSLYENIVVQFGRYGELL